jgi:membrane-bound serine protease (ClpP class)
MIPRATPRRHFTARRLSVVLLLAGVLVGLLSAAAPAQSTGALVDVVEVEGIIDQTIADYIIERIDRAATDGAQAVVISLDTPGGLGISMDQIEQAITSSKVPVTVWVGPPGAQAASAGMYIAYASHVLAMAPATTLGAATPVDLGGDDLDAKVSNSAEAQLVALAELRGRDVDFARAAVRDGAVVAIGEAEELPEGAELPSGIDAEDVSVVSGADLEQ